MKYIAILDYAHLDNALFLKSFADAMSAQENTRGIILHGDSTYTQRLIQTGMLTKDARERSIKDLNHRLISLLADSGVPAIGVNAYQRDIIYKDEITLRLNKKFLTDFPHNTHLVLSNLIGSTQGETPIPYNLTELASTLNNQLQLDEIFIFSKNEADEILLDSPKSITHKMSELNDEFISSRIPDDLQELPIPCRIITTRSFRKLPNLVDSIFIY